MKHGGNIYQFARHLGCRPEQVLDFSANINPLQAVDLGCLQQVELGPYADPDYRALKEAIVRRYPIPANADIELFNGASAAIFALLRRLRPAELVLYTPLYGEYGHIAGQLGCRVHNIDRIGASISGSGAEIPRGSTVIFVNPSTPDGQLYQMQELLAAWRAADCNVIVDESFLDFCLQDAGSVAAQSAHDDKLYVIKSLSKFYGCAGIRVGFIVAAAQAIKELKKLEPAWKLSSLDMAYMEEALSNSAFIEQTRQQTTCLRKMLFQVLQASGLFDKIYPGQANFLLARLADGRDGYQLQAQLASSRILIRVCDNFEGLDKSHVRFAVKDEQAINRLASSLNTVTTPALRHEEKI